MTTTTPNHPAASSSLTHQTEWFAERDANPLLLKKFPISVLIKTPSKPWSFAAAAAAPRFQTPTPAIYIPLSSLTKFHTPWAAVATVGYRRCWGTHCRNPAASSPFLVPTCCRLAAGREVEHKCAKLLPGIERDRGGSRWG